MQFVEQESNTRNELMQQQQGRGRGGGQQQDGDENVLMVEENNNNNNNTIIGNGNIASTSTIVLIGEDADLSPLRHIDTRETALKQRISCQNSTNHDINKSILLPFLQCNATLVVQSTNTDLQERQQFNNISGSICCTTKQILFISDNSNQHDVLIGANCISLHAMTEQDNNTIEENEDDNADDDHRRRRRDDDGEQQGSDGSGGQSSEDGEQSIRSIYLQVQPSENEEDGIEFTIIPKANTVTYTNTNSNNTIVSDSSDDSNNGVNNNNNLVEQQQQQQQQQNVIEEDDTSQFVFQALCRLVSLNPVQDDDDNNDNREHNNALNNSSYNMAFPMSENDFYYTREQEEEEDDIDDTIINDHLIWRPSNNNSNSNSNNSTMRPAFPDNDDIDIEERDTNGYPSHGYEMFGCSTDTRSICPTDEERLSMLQHLDSILCVKKELEIEEGQFDDAMSEDEEQQEQQEPQQQQQQ